MDIKLAHNTLINNLTSIPDGHDDLHFYLKTLKGDVPEDHKPSKVECLEHLELKVNEQIRQMGVHKNSNKKLSQWFR